MKKLNGKCLEAYSRWSHEITQNQTVLPTELFERLENALIIDFFDFVGIKIGIIPKNNSKMVMGRWLDVCHFDVYINFDSFGVWSNRTEATENAIIQSNRLFNENIL